MAAEAAKPTGPALLVPITLEAAVVTGEWEGDDWHYNGSWSWGRPNYKMLSSSGQVDPSPLAKQEPAFPGYEDFAGVVLHWALPDGLTQGRREADGSIGYPPVPNRWLVVRKAPPPATTWSYAAWVIESDALDPPGGAHEGSPYPPQPGDPLSKSGAAMVGAAYPLGEWPPAKPLGRLDPPLTAVGPGSHSFAASAPLVQNVLSFPDQLLDAERKADLVPPGPLTYAVYGWYSDPALDPMFGPGSGGWQTEAEWGELMEGFSWVVSREAVSAGEAWAKDEGIVVDPGDPRTRFPTRMICHGLLFDVEWLGSTGTYVSGAPPTSPSVGEYVKPAVAVGNTPVDALTALLAEGDPREERLQEVLAAFQHDALALLDLPDAPDRIHQRVQESWYGTFDGGVRWAVANPDGDAPPPLEGEEAGCLTLLNEVQDDLDATARELMRQQWQLFSYWRLERYAEEEAPPVPAPLAAAAAALRAEIEGLVDRYRYLRARRDEVLAVLRDRLEDAEVKGIARPPFQQPVDPAVVVSGARRSYKHGEDGRFLPGGKLECRFSGQTVAGIAVDAGGTEPVLVGGADVPLLALGGHPDLPPELTDLGVESFFLDPLGAPTIASKADPPDPWRLLAQIRRLQTQIWNSAASPALDAEALTALRRSDGGLAPGLQTRYGLGAIPSKVGVEAWAPPWTPLYLEWRLRFRPGAATGPETLDPDRWSLAPADVVDPQLDTTYVWKGGDVSKGGQVSFSGRTLLTPQVSDTFAARIEQLLEAHASEPLAQEDLWALQEALDYVENADLLSQSLSGLGAALLERQATTFSSSAMPGEAIDPSLAPYLNPAGAPALQPGEWPILGAAAEGFNPIRAGHAEITDLWVVDAFGQVFDVIAARQDPQGLRPVKAPDLAVEGGSAEALELKPRVAQPGRLRLDFLDAGDETREAGVWAGADPVCGWTMANGLDRGLLFYDADGVYLGELMTSESGALWLPPPEQGPLPESGDPLAPGALAGVLNRHLREAIAGIAAAPGGVESVLALVEAASVGKPGSGQWADDELQVLVGRPLAIVRAGLGLELEGRLDFRQAYEAAGKGETRGFEQVEFEIRLGSTELLDDGLVGYWLEDDYGAIHSVYSGKGTGTYADAKRPRLAQGAREPLTLLLDPSLEVHAVSGVLPALSVSLPPEFAKPDLSRMEATFRVGPVLDLPAEAGVTLPLPAIQEGEWAWLEYESPEAPAATLPVTEAAPLPRLPDGLPWLRNGWLRLDLVPAPTRLTYRAAPAVVQCGNVAALAFSAYNGSGEDLTCTRLVLEVEVGEGAADLASTAEGMGLEIAGWKVEASGDGAFTAVPAGGKAQLKAGETLSLLLGGVAVNATAGTTAVTVKESMAGSSGAEETEATEVAVTKAAR